MSGIFITTPSVRRLTAALGDVAAVSIALAIAWAIRFRADALFMAESERLHVRMAVLVAAVLLCFYYNDLYLDRAPRDKKDLLIRISKAHLASGILLSLLYYAIPSIALGRGILLLFFPQSLLFLFVWRDVFYWVLQGSLAENVLILGTGSAAKNMAHEILHRRGEGYNVVGFLSDDPALVGKRLVNPSVVGTLDQLRMLSHQMHVDTLVVALEDRRGKLPLSELLRCKLDGVRVEDSATFFETLTGQLPVRNMHPGWLVFSPGFKRIRLFHSTRRFLEFVLALLAIIISLPVLALAALLIVLEGGFPILYRQERVGQKGRLFELYKLRTMKPNAEKSTGAVWTATKGDPRITWAGRFLRSSRMDELPQLFNVLKGDMSFVGPRPERPFFVEKLREHIPYYDERHSVKPGITGWAQVRFGYGSSIEDAETKLRYDMYYIKNMGFWLDLVIVLDTVKVILFGKGAR